MRPLNVRVFGKRIEVPALQNHRAGVILRLGAQRLLSLSMVTFCCSIVTFKRNVDRFAASGYHLNVRIFEGSKAACVIRRVLLARREPAYDVVSI